MRIKGQVGLVRLVGLVVASGFSRTVLAQSPNNAATEIVHLVAIGHRRPAVVDGVRGGERSLGVSRASYPVHGWDGARAIHKASCTRPSALTFWQALATCFFTVRSEMPSDSAMRLLRQPSDTAMATRCSWGVSIPLVFVTRHTRGHAPRRSTHQLTRA